ncbi:hypothetical protein EDB84DRAFT_1437754 [Lactarius hengduanensis]|nr:hypothetical protein EDB84DRAFT_1437754 [Lactarius hengduanensis]
MRTRALILSPRKGPAILLKEAWARENNNKIAAWNEQLEQVRAEQEELDRQVQEEEDAQQVLRDKEAEEQRKEADKKKPKLNPFDPNRTLGNSIEPRPAQYALNKVNNLEYVELDYFTLRGCKDATADANRSISQDTLVFTQVEGTFTIRPLAAIKPSRNVRCDEELSWEEMFDCQEHHAALHGKVPGLARRSRHVSCSFLRRAGATPQKEPRQRQEDSHNIPEPRQARMVRCSQTQRGFQH